MRVARVLVVTALVVASLPRVATAASARLTPTRVALDLAAGRSRTLDYALSLAAQPARPTDVYLLVDGGAGMRRFLPAVRSGIGAALRPLADRGVRVGVGEFRTTSAAEWTGGLTYRTLRRVGAVDRDLARAVDRLGRDQAPALPGPAAHPVALDEAVTGDGYRPYVGPGHEAGFAVGSRKVVVVVTDAAFANDPTQPGRSSVTATLRRAGVEVFGLALHPDALGDLTALAAGTGSVAETAVDCGAGRVAAGRPAACVASPGAIGEALTGMLYERRRGRLTVSATGPGVRRLAPRAWWVDLNAPARQTFRLEVTCAPGDAGRRHEVVLDVALSGGRVARAHVTVSCLRAR